MFLDNMYQCSYVSSFFWHYIFMLHTTSYYVFMFSFYVACIILMILCFFISLIVFLSINFGFHVCMGALFVRNQMFFHYISYSYILQYGFLVNNYILMCLCMLCVFCYYIYVFISIIIHIFNMFVYMFTNVHLKDSNMDFAMYTFCTYQHINLTFLP
jgi:hypothetical protein